MDIEHEVNIPTLLQRMHYAGSKDQESGGLLFLWPLLSYKRCDNFPYEYGMTYFFIVFLSCL